MSDKKKGCKTIKSAGTSMRRLRQKAYKARRQNGPRSKRKHHIGPLQKHLATMGGPLRLSPGASAGCTIFVTKIMEIGTQGETTLPYAGVNWATREDANPLCHRVGY